MPAQIDVQRIQERYGPRDLERVYREGYAAVDEYEQWKQRQPKLGELLFGVAQDIEKPEPWTSTGLEPLDNLLDGGVRKGEVCVVAARPGVGKSALALQIILHVAEQGLPVALWSLEMRPKQWIRRAIAAVSGISAKKLRTGQVPEDDLPAFLAASERLHKIPLHFAQGSTTPADWREEAMRQCVHNEAQLLVIDYLQLMDPPPGAHNRENEVAQQSKMIKRMANSAEVGVILLAQLNRDAEGRVPTLRDLRESGAIEQDADEVFFLHRDQDPETRVVQRTGMGILAKNRDGETGAFGLEFDPWRFRFNPAHRESHNDGDWRVRKTNGRRR